MKSSARCAPEPEPAPGSSPLVAGFGCTGGGVTVPVMTTPTATATPTLRSTVPGVTTARTVDSVNPADLGDVVARVELAGPDAIVAAARRANAAQQQWAAVPAPVRGRVIAAIGRLVEANVDALAALVTREVGKPIVE